MNPRRFAIIAVLAAALFLAAAAGAFSAQDVAAQEPPTWNEDGELVVAPPTLEGNCGRWPAGSPYVLEFLNQDVGLYAVCVSPGRVYHRATYDCYDDDDDGSTPDQCDLRTAAYYTYYTVYALHFDPDTDFSHEELLESELDMNWTLVGHKNFPAGDPAPSTALADQPTMVKRGDSSSRRTSNVSQYDALIANTAITGTPSMLTFYTESDLLEPTDAPATPMSLTADRTASYDAVELGWELYDPASEYEIERLSAVAVSVGDTNRIEYGDPSRFNIGGTIAGVDLYADSTAEANKTYQYRIRARGDTDDWSSWSSYIFSGAQPDADIDAPSNVSLDRADDNSSVTVEWSAPSGDFDHYTLQRQELVVQDSSTFFANAVTLGNPWLSTASLEYEDTAILPGQTYEYRVAAVKDDLVGEYTDWARSSPVDKHLGPAPDNLQIESDSAYLFRREVWLGWDEVDGADDYEVGVLKSELATGLETLESLVYTDNSYFHTGFSRAAVRVRARKHDDDLCGAGTNDYCYTAWTGWLPLGFTPVFEVESPDGVLNPPTPDADVTKLRANFVSVLEAAFAPIGLAVATDVLLNLGVLFVAAIPAGLAAWRGRLTGMLGIGLGDGVAYFIMTLALGVRLLQLPESWLIGALSLVLVGGGLAMAKSFGILGRS